MDYLITISNQTYFQDKWLEADEFSSWVARMLDDNKKAKVKFVERALSCLT